MRCWWSARSSGASDVIGEVVNLARARGLPVLHGRLVPDAAAVTALKPHKVLAFAGIGDPEKFFATVAAAGIAIATTKSFPDHHRYTAEEAAELVMDCEHESLTLLTTEKDHARMSGDPALSALARARASAAGDDGGGGRRRTAKAGAGRAGTLSYFGYFALA